MKKFEDFDDFEDIESLCKNDPFDDFDESPSRVLFFDRDYEIDTEESEEEDVFAFSPHSAVLHLMRTESKASEDLKAFLNRYHWRSRAFRDVITVFKNSAKKNGAELYLSFDTVEAAGIVDFIFKGLIFEDTEVLNVIARYSNMHSISPVDELSFSIEVHIPFEEKEAGVV